MLKTEEHLHQTSVLLELRLYQENLENRLVVYVGDNCAGANL